MLDRCARTCCQLYLKQLLLQTAATTTKQTKATIVTAAPHNEALALLQQPQHQHRRWQQPRTNNISTISGKHLSKHPIDMPHSTLSEDHARDLIFNLKDSERDAIKKALIKYDAMMQKEGFAGSLAATKWRTRFGRPAQLPRLGEVDPSGSFCAFPDNWLKERAVAKAQPPSKSDLQRIFIVNAVPFLAFGFLDNFCMIIAGDSIESFLGGFMCISTMAAAGLGNTVSDVLGIGSALYVERGCEMLGLRMPDISPVQMEMKTTRQWANWGRIVGITIGCLIGMTPLLFIKRDCEPDDQKVANKTAKT